MSPEKMVHMANQIATFFASQPGDPAEKVAAHLRDYWEPRMRQQFQDYVATGGEGLSPAAQEAARLL
ncbi:formate dehydrogenase subunit delta [Paracoccus spongiarum]|uniref:Formate dehydrogenase subunit delta n=1 Tax=Paracoccus spongiarum TaxID=3064387 RepID=A0ABT9J7Y9_9RHOB|nr:formate dehydrogenase subunit delta [Paracoccus sp. 2205BS29-5]MDP5305749.1 formate dehydrogenase subunit delta [Paracoccus sp. 2205BS29-5]